TSMSIRAAAGAPFAQQIGYGPAIPVHMNQADIESGQVSFQDAVRHGEKLFTAVFNKFDGQGRPVTQPGQPGMVRITGPDSHSCTSCHNRPLPGGGGDFPTNVFVMDENERMTVSLFGSGPVEMLAREMTRELQAIRMAAINQAFLS